MTQTLDRRVVSSVLWTGSARIIQQIAQFVFSVILARILSPEDFGAVGMILVITNFIALFSSSGFGSAIVQKQDLDVHHFSSVFWFTLLVGIILSGFTFLSSSLVAQFYRLPQLEPLMNAIAPMFFISSVGIVPLALLQKRLDFRTIALINLTSTLASGVIGVGLAASGFGLTSLIAQNLSHALLIASLSLLLCGWHVTLNFHFDAIGQLLKFTLNLSGFNFVNYWARNADNLLIGRVMGPYALGLYSRAYGLMLLPITQIISVISDTMFSALSSIQSDLEQVKALFLKGLHLITVITLPMMIGLMVTAEPFVLAVYGLQWAEIIPIVRILCAVGALQSIISPMGWIYTSQGRTDLMLRFGLMWSIATVTGILIGISFGSLTAIAASYTASNIVVLYPAISLPSRLIDMRAQDVIVALRKPLLATLAMSLFVILTSMSEIRFWRSDLQLLILVLEGAFVYLVSLVLLRDPVVAIGLGFLRRGIRGLRFI